ncbi:MAG: ABC transporter permease subunit [Bacillota bacterium]
MQTNEKDGLDEYVSARHENSLRRYRRYRHLTLLLLPGIIYFVIFRYLPIYGLTIAFKDFKFMDGILGSAWVGLDVFKEVFGRAAFWEVFRNTFIISIYKLIWGFTPPIIFALLLNEIRNATFKKITQTISYLPYFVSWVILGGLFIQFLSPSIGPVNIILKTLGIHPIYFLGDPKWFRTTLVVTDIWKSLGWGSIIYLASLSNIDAQMYEAAEMDGANRFQKMRYITLPSLAPVITIMLILAVGKLVNDNFDQIFNLYNPAVYRVGDVLGTYTYREGLENMSYSYATAVEFFKNVIAFALVIAANKVAGKINEYGIW